MKWGRKQRRELGDLRPQQEAILAKVRERVELTETGCWYWKLKKTEGGYARMYFKGQYHAVTRLVYAAVHGPFDKNLDICHTCDNPACCNPQHIWAGEHQANLQDGSKKKRLQGQWKTHCKRGHPLSGDNLSPYSKFRGCLICAIGRGRLRMGWPEKYAFDPSIKVPDGYMLDRETGSFVPITPKRNSIST